MTYTRIKPNTTYSVSTFGTSSMYNLFYDEAKNLVGYVLSNTSTFTSPSNARYMRFTFNTSEIDIFQLEENTVATPYEPYTESTQYLPNVGELRSLPNGVRDEIRIG